MIFLGWGGVIENTICLELFIFHRVLKICFCSFSIHIYEGIIIDVVNNVTEINVTSFDDITINCLVLGNTE